MYQLTNSNSVIRLDDGAFIPLAEGNTDYQKYKAWLDAGNTPIPVPVPSLAEVKANLVTGIDDYVAMVYAGFTRFDAEYTQREAAAQAFKDGGYQGDPGTWVTAFATAAGMTNQAAADLILTQATNLRAALQALGAQRMRKYGITAAATQEAAQALSDDILAQVKTIAAGL